MNIQSMTGQVLGQYELRELLGFGGMGVAYRGYQRSLEREVAVKVLSPSLASEAGYIERFYREAKTAAALEHAHIVPVYDYGVQGDISYVVMRLLTGGSLEDRMKHRADQDRPLPSLGEVSDLLTKLGSALDYAHSHGVIHRDIKPGNIMFSDQGTPYVVDFGLAKLLETTSAVTASGVMMGTPVYMPPEQWRSMELTPAADQYAMAVTIYQLITGGKLPFEANTPYAMMIQHINEPPTPPQTHREDLPVAVAGVLERALEKEPADRYPSMAAFADDFKAAAEEFHGELTGFFTTPILIKTPHVMGLPGGTSGGQPPSTVIIRPAYRSPAFWGLAVALIVVVGVLLYFLAAGGGEPDLQAQVNETLTAVRVASNLTGTTRVELTAAAATATSTPDASATAAQQTRTAVQATQTQVADDAAATAAVESSEQAVATADAAATSSWLATTAAEETSRALTATRRAQNETATAAHWTSTPTSTPTSTDTATATQTPTATATQSPTATPQPNMRAVYNGEEFILVNTSGQPIDIRALVFEQRPPESGRNFSASVWGEGGSDLSQMRPGGCYQLVTFEGTRNRPPRDLCPTYLGWFRLGTADGYFWLSDDPDAEFVVRRAPNPQPLAVCLTAEGECQFRFP